ncbi:MAG: LysM peptidoglycan-binding domain-containing protein [Phenylobacterium sp.]|uniref:LysM peptidoglycan-binding domain-containing protein n=1 Tax=Phenylobacterium sp. TaxID=1871053 RepID=UPI00391B8F0E
MNIRILAAVLATLALAACAQTAKTPPVAAGSVAGAAPEAPTPPAFVATPGLGPMERQKKAVDLLDKGEADQARAELQALLEQQPSNAVAKRLLDQIDRDPRALLGEKNFAYTVRSGDTMSGLAQRFLGDPLMFYALARYNGIVAPSQMAVGRTLQIPGAPRPAVAAAPKDAAAPAPQGGDPARAAALRRSGLEELNRGAVDRAVSLLRQAQGLDPASAAIQKDLERALRVQKTVNAAR